MNENLRFSIKHVWELILSRCSHAVDCGLFSLRFIVMMGSLYRWLRSQNLQNRYFIIRHGESKANVAGLIVSSPANGVEKYGLSDKGCSQVSNAFIAEKRLAADTVIVSSDFKRTLETAAIAFKCLSASTQVQIEPLLRERYFGEWELGDSKNYEKVWQSDADDPNHTEQGVESVLSVLERLNALLKIVEANYVDKNVLLVSHGDILQMLQTAFDGVEPSKHRSIPHLNTAEIRQLIVK